MLQMVVVNLCIALVVSLCVLSGPQDAVEACPHDDQINHHTNGRCEDGGNVQAHIQLGGGQNMTLSEAIWNGAEDLIPKAWNTTFISGVANGNMNPDFYGRYILQDAIYLRKLQQLWVQLWVQLANSTTNVDERIREYAKNSSSTYRNYSIDIFNGWNVIDNEEDDYGIIAKEPVIKYVTFINNTMLAKPANMLIATYACLKLWHNLTGDLKDMVNFSNPYRDWVHNNHGSDSSVQRQAALMDALVQSFDLVEAKNLFRDAVENEIYFFEKGGLNSTELDSLKEGSIRVE